MGIINRTQLVVVATLIGARLLWLAFTFSIEDRVPSAKGWRR